MMPWTFKQNVAKKFIYKDCSRVVDTLNASCQAVKLLGKIQDYTSQIRWIASVSHAPFKQTQKSIELEEANILF